jgi:DNA-binding NarL/FixJ family response regulator
MKPNHPQTQQPQRPQGNPGQHGQSGRKASPGARKVLTWLAQGHDMAAIARRLGRDEQRMKEHLAALLARLGVDSPQAALEQLKAQHAASSAPPTQVEAPVADEFSDIDVDAAEGTTTK